MFDLPSEVTEIIHTIDNAGFEAVLVGGPVRDLLRGAKPHDWDIATSASPEQVMQLFDKTIPTGIQHGTVTVCMGTMMCEVTTYRKETEYRDHRKPESVVFVRRLEEDLKRRDFTINAMAYRLDGTVVDLYGGQADLQQKIIRAVGDARERFEEDALRILRAVRFACKLDFEPEEQTVEAMKEKAPYLQCVSKERIAAELFATLNTAAVRHLRLLPQTGLTTYCLPELAHRTLARWERVIALLEQLPPQKELRLAALFSDDNTDTSHNAENAVAALKRLKTDHITIRRVETLLRYPAPRISLTDAEIKRLVRTVGEPLLEMSLWLGWIRTDERQQVECAVQQTMQRYQMIKSRREVVFLQDLAISGHDLKKIGVSGRAIGALLQQLLELVTEHPEQNEKTWLLEKAKRMREKE